MTSIEWLANGFANIYPELELNDKFFELLKESKEMHRQEILDAFTEGASDGYYGESDSNRERYYNEQFKKD